ncbi:MAG: hypothetical protein ACI9AX_002515, partial [Polaromonas sp.]
MVICGNPAKMYPKICIRGEHLWDCKACTTSRIAAAMPKKQPRFTA